MQDILHSVEANLIYQPIGWVLGLIAVILLNKFTARAADTQIELRRKEWVGRLFVSVFCSMILYLLLAYLFAAIYKWRGWEMDSGATYGVIGIGIALLPVSFIAFLLVAPADWRGAILVGIASVYYAWGYLVIVASFYQLAFKLMEGLPGV